MSTELTNTIVQAKEKFLSIAENNPEIKVEWQRESMFALQQIQKNEMTQDIAHKSPASLRNAIINVASIGLSLNPATAYAYLVPRDNQICLDISYRGLIKIATDTGSIMWAKADVVYEQDQFTYYGPAKPPYHEADPFSKERGDIRGVYCIAKTHDGDYLVEAMSREELDDIKGKSKGAKSPYSPWNTFYTEMCKKAVIKRASKTWPKTDRHEHLDKVIEYVNEEEGINFNEASKEDIELYDRLLHEGNGAALRNLYDDDWEYWARVEATFYKPRQKVKFKEMVKNLMQQAIDTVVAVQVGMMELDDNNDIEAAVEMYSELSEEENKVFWNHIEPATKIRIDNILNV